jgi:starch-binding outer membrane protein, SusD/RagB family
MKKLIYGIMTVTVLGFSACDDLLDIPPVSEIAADSYYNNEEQINTALMGAYNGMQKPLLTEWMLTEVRSDNAVQQTPGSSSANNLDLNDLDMFRPSSSMQAIYDYWYASYQNISSVNAVLDNINVVPAGTLKNQYEGEARFIRAYHYFNLVRLYGPLFITTEVISPKTARETDRSPVSEVYELIVSDLEFASMNLPATYPPAQLGRATSWAAKTLLAKVYMTTQRPNLAKPLLLDVKDNSGHQLLPKYEDVFSIQKEMNSEIIFAIRYKAGGLGLGSSFANLFAPSQSGANIINGDGSGYNYPSSNFMLTFPSQDLRRNVTVSVWNQKNYIKKFLSPVTVRYDAENDWPILRYADVLLLLAEIYNEEEGPANALPLIKLVRSRAGLPDLDNNISQAHCRLAIENERRFEFAFENQRWFDLLRTNRAIEVVENQIFTSDYETHYRFYPPALRPDQGNIIREWQLLLPIPQREIDTNNEIIISQNLGY